MSNNNLAPIILIHPNISITCYLVGPNGMNKLVVNHLEKIIVTSDCATIMQELEVQHPAAKMLVLASEMQQNEYGDNTNFVSIPMMRYQTPNFCLVKHHIIT